MYGKIFKSIYYGSLADNRDARDLLIFLCAHADREGFVDMTLKSCGLILRWSQEQLERAAAELSSPDPESSTPEEEGRRIKVRGLGIRGIWIVNYLLYSKLQSARDKQEWMADYYERTLKPKRSNESDRVKKRQLPSTESDHVAVAVDGAVTGTGDTEQQTLPLAGSRRGVSKASLQNGEKLPEGEITADEAFLEVFWPEYPRKRDREDAFRAWKALKLRDDDDETIGRIMAALRRDVREEWRDRAVDKIPYPAHWLRTKGWTD
jgi:hypothetical protein